MKYPRISIITACYNMEKYIERTILSVISQNYPNLEYIIIDGKSTDSTINIIKRYEDKISLIISESDSGMYDAINKGFKYATGEIYAWLNADDIYFPWTLHTVAKLFGEHPDAMWAIGQMAFMLDDNHVNKIYNFPCAYSKKSIANGWYQPGILGALQQESMFWRKDLWEKSKGLDLTYKLAGDYELWTRFALYSELTTIAMPLAAFYVRSDSLSHDLKTKEKYYNEVNTVFRKLNSNYPNIIIKYCGKNIIISYLYRLFKRHKSPLFLYSEKKKKWVLKKTYRSISNNTLSFLINEWKFNK